MSSISDLTTEALRLAVLADEVWADLCQQFGRASQEGHAVGQMLAEHQRAKLEPVGRTLRALAAENAALRGERDAARQAAACADAQCERDHARAEAAEARVKVLEGALREMYDATIEGTFYDDYDEATARCSRARTALGAAS